MSQASSNPQFLPDPAAFSVLVSPARLAPYLAAVSGDPGRASQLYAWNAAVSSAFFEVLSYVEVIFRNTCNNALTDLHDQTAPASPLAWFDEHPTPWVAHHWLDKIARGARDTAVRRAGHALATPRPDKVIAELTFGWWRYLASDRYTQSFWIPALDAAFPSIPARTPDERRSRLEHQLIALNALRNRVAHHEPIFYPVTFQLSGGVPVSYNALHLYALAIEFIEWINAPIAHWLMQNNRLHSLLTERPL